MSLITAFATSAQAVGVLDLADASARGALSDDSLLAAHGLLMEHRRHADTLAARVAGEIARRSPREGGYSGLAQRRGFGSPGALLQNLAPVTAVEATQLIEAGALMATPPSTMWEAALGDALEAGSVSIAAVDAIPHAVLRGRKLLESAASIGNRRLRRLREPRRPHRQGMRQ